MREDIVVFGCGLALLVVVAGCGSVAVAGRSREPMVRRCVLFLTLQNVGAVGFYVLALGVMTTTMRYRVWIDMAADVGQAMFLWAVAFRAYRLAIVFDVAARSSPRPSYSSLSAQMTSAATTTTTATASSSFYSTTTGPAAFPPPPRPPALSDASLYGSVGGAPPTLADSPSLLGIPPSRHAPADADADADADGARSTVSAAESACSELIASIKSPYMVTPAVQAADAGRPRPRLTLAGASLRSTWIGASMWESDEGDDARLGYAFLLKRYAQVVTVFVALAWSWNLVQALTSDKRVLEDIKIALLVFSALLYAFVFAYCIFLLRSVDKRFKQSKELVVISVISLASRVAIIWKVWSSSYDAYERGPVFVLLATLLLYTLVSSVYPTILLTIDFCFYGAADIANSRNLPLFDSVGASPRASRRFERAPLFEARLRHHDVRSVASLSRAMP